MARAMMNLRTLKGRKEHLYTGDSKVACGARGIHIGGVLASELDKFMRYPREYRCKRCEPTAQRWMAARERKVDAKVEELKKHEELLLKNHASRGMQELLIGGIIGAFVTQLGQYNEGEHEVMVLRMRGRVLGM